MTDIETIANKDRGHTASGAVSVFSLLREAAQNLPASEWGAACLRTMMQAAHAEAGLLLDGGGVVLASFGLDESERGDLALFAMGHDSDGPPLRLELERKTFTVLCVPLKSESRCTGIAVLASERVSFAEHTRILNSELLLLGSAMLSSSPGVRQRL